MVKKTTVNSYNNESITSLKGADRVRLRPGVIFGSDGIDGCQHSVFEIVSNSIDEAREGYGKKIEITLFKDKSIEVRDYGRGMPVDFNNKEAKSVNKINLKVDDKSKYRLVYNNPFVIDNRVYFYLENQNTLENNYYLAYYDMENNKFDYIDNKINLELPLESYQQNVEGEKLNLLSDTENKSKVDLSLYTIDLTTGKIVINNEQYSIKKLNKNMCLNTFRIIDNKIYILSKTSNADNMNSRLDGEYTDNVIVLDKNSKSTLYIGEYMQGEAYRSESYILKNNEL